MSHPHSPQRCLHFDFHTPPKVGPVGAGFDRQAFVATLQNAAVEAVNVFARCNVGFAYYPTQIGVPHPGLEGDLLGGMVEACGEIGVKVYAYFNVRLDHEHAFRHREWCRVAPDGRVERAEKPDHFFRDMCLNTGYADHLLGMIREVVERYPVDGIFLDCINAKPCIGSECRSAMLARGLDPACEKAQVTFAKETVAAFQKKVETLIGSIPERELSLVFNGVAYRDQPTHIEVETLPGGGWGYDALPWQLRYARTLGKRVVAMTGRFQEGWGDFGGLLPKASMAFDCQLATALGAAVSIGDHLHPLAGLEPAVYRRITEIYQELAELDPWVRGAKPMAEIAIVEPGLANYPQSYFPMEPLMGATRILSELKSQFDVVDGGDLCRYKVVILPDHTVLSEALKADLLKFIGQGGFVISSGSAGLEDGVFFQSQGALRSAGPEPCHPAYFTPHPPEADAMPVTIYEPGILLEGEGEHWAKIHQPHANYGFRDERHWHLYNPPVSATDRPALMEAGRCFHFSFPIFSGYYRHAGIAYRDLVERVLRKALPLPLVRGEHLPRSVQVMLTAQPGRTMVHLIAYQPESRGAKLIVEEGLHIPATRVTLRLTPEMQGTATIAGSGMPLKTCRSGDALEVEIPAFCGYQLLVIE